jgi:AraC-like DNA-binding protein
MNQHVTRHRFTDFGQLRRHLRCADVDATQLSPGLLSGAYDCIDAGDAVVSHLTFNRSAAIRATGHAGWHALIVDLSPKQWCGIDLAAGVLRVMSPERETRVLCRDPWDTITAFVRDDALRRWGSPFTQMAGRDADPAGGILRTDQTGVDRYRTWIETLLRASLPDESWPWQNAVREELRCRLLDVLGGRTHPEPVSPARRVARYELVLAALRLVQRRRRISIRELSVGLGVTERALQYAFTSVVGVSPARFILADRLNRVRRQLMIDAPAGGTVTTAAFAHRFENLSRFAHQYARLFGERPSATLRAAREALRQTPDSRTTRRYGHLPAAGYRRIPMPSALHAAAHGASA